MQILTVAQDLDAQGGLERAPLHACRELRVRGHRINLLYTHPGDLVRVWDLIVDRKVRVRGYRLSRDSPFATGAALLDVAITVRRLAPDMVYLHNPYHAPSIALSGRRSMCHLHLPAPAELSKQDEEHYRIRIEDDELIPENLDSIENMVRFVTRAAEHRYLLLSLPKRTDL